MCYVYYTYTSLTISLPEFICELAKVKRALAGAIHLNESLYTHFVTLYKFRTAIKQREMVCITISKASLNYCRDEFEPKLLMQSWSSSIINTQCLRDFDNTQMKNNN